MVQLDRPRLVEKVRPCLLDVRVRLEFAGGQSATKLLPGLGRTLRASLALMRVLKHL
jgi:hypothetical protein